MSRKDRGKEPPSEATSYTLPADHGAYTITGADAKLQSPVTDDHLKAIGRISVNFSNLEFGMKLCINQLLGVGQDEGLIVTAQLGFRQLTTVLHQLYRRRNIDDKVRLAKIDALAGRIDRAREARDTIIHSSWLVAMDGEAIGVKYPRTRPQWFSPTISKMKPSELEDVAKKIKVVADEIGALIIEVSEEAATGSQRLVRKAEGAGP
jgi:hypothetical protein